MNEPLREVDPQIYDLIKQEYNRVMSTVQLIASENFPARAVLDATGAPLQHKYAEGLPIRIAQQFHLPVPKDERWGW